MHPPSHRRDRRFGTPDSVPRALLFAAAMAIGCGFADGVTQRVMAQLAEPATLPTWRRPAVVLLWVLAVGAVMFSLPGLVRVAISWCGGGARLPDVDGARPGWRTRLEHSGLRDAQTGRATSCDFYDR